MKILLVLVTAVVFLLSILLVKASHILPVNELKRRARNGKKSSYASVYKLATYGHGADLLLWLIAVLSFTALAVRAASVGWWLVASLVLIGGWLAIGWKPRRATGMTWRTAGFIAPAMAWVLSLIHPLTDWLSRHLQRFWPANVHTGAFEKEDLLQLLKTQNRLSDNRVPASELKIAYQALTFGDKTVGQAMTPLRRAKIVPANEPIGPHLMEDLHKSGFVRFAVARDSAKIAVPKIIGSLYIGDLVGHGDSGKVSDLMKPGVHYVNEADSLRSCLDGFLKTHNHLLVVVNKFEELVGVITLEDVLEQILGEKIADEFSRYDDLRAVASRDSQKEHGEHLSPRVE